MIGSIKGEITYKGATFLIIEANGVGYKTYVTSAVVNLAREGKEMFLWTYMAVRENALDLYGFPEREEIEFFQKLISIPGIGPKSGLSVLNTASVKSLKQGISLGDTTASATPDSVARLLSHLASRCDISRFGVHFHDATGRALANIDRAP